MTFAYVQNDKIQMISSVDTVEWQGLTITSVRLLTPAERRDRGIYDFIPAGSVPKYHRAGSASYVIDNAAGTVTETVAAVPWPIEDVITDVKAKLAEYRYAIETGGITVAGVAVKTDRESQATLTGAWVQVQTNPAALIDWKGNDGWTQIDKATVVLLAGAVGTHVQKCFTCEKRHSDAIDALTTVNEVVAYDITTGWTE